MTLSNFLNEDTVRLIMGTVLVLVISYAIYYSISVYLLLKKAKYKNPWAAWVPFYQQWAINEIAGKPGWWTLVGLGSFITFLNPDSILLESLGNVISLTGIILQIIVDINLAKAFGKSMKYALGLIFFPFPMYLVLALSDAKHTRLKKAKNRKR